MPPDQAPGLTLISSNYPCLKHIVIVPKVFKPLKFDYMYISPQKVIRNGVKGDGRIIVLGVVLTGMCIGQTVSYMYRYLSNKSMNFTHT